uniref:C-type lectin domain-containing protein n=1 Tax=Astatotilapia calliptera TaxID=8154 RepID=A0A3P8NNJ1_ASTCA
KASERPSSNHLINKPCQKSRLCSSTCPDNWSEFGGRCFHYVSVQMTWAEAEVRQRIVIHSKMLTLCLVFGHKIAALSQQLVIRAASLFSRRTWIGGTDCQMNDLWLWSDGSHFLFSAWKPGQPDNWGSNESCIEINYQGNSLKHYLLKCLSCLKKHFNVASHK